MATIKTKQPEPSSDNKKTSRIPLRQYLEFRKAKDAGDVDLLNYRCMEKELDRERHIARSHEKHGDLFSGNGLDMFLAACKRRLSEARWHRVLDHSENVRRYAYCIALTHERQKGLEGKVMDDMMVDVVAAVAGYHDIGKTIIAEYLINREDGTMFGMGKGERIDFKKELTVLQNAHVEAGVRMLEIYRNFMSEEVFQMAKWIIGGHHLAFDGDGTASARSYPKEIDGVDMKKRIIENGLPPVARIIRAADVYSAIMENRFYLAESERVVTKVVNMEPDDTALGLLITVAGADVDPFMVKCLLIGKYKVAPHIAAAVVDDLSCKEKSCLKQRGGDIKFSLENVIPEPSFLEIVTGRRNTDWRVMNAMLAMSPV